MFALPPGWDGRAGPQLTAVTCPDCPGILTLSVQGDARYLHFECRIGHSYSVGELIALKERRLEETLWSSITALDELLALLEDLGSRIPGRDYADRLARGRRHLAAVRQICDENKPTELDHPPEEDG